MIYIGDKQQKLAGIFREKLSTNQNQIELFASFEGLLPKLEQDLPHLLLLNHNLLQGLDLSNEPRREKLKALFENAPTVVYADSMDMEDRLHYYQLGIKRVIVEPMGLVSMIASVCTTLLERHKNLRLLKQQSLNYGTLHGYALQEILQNAVLEKKNLIINVKSNGWGAKIRVLNGHIVSAAAPGLKDEDAVLKTLHLPIGRCIIRRYQKETEYASMRASTAAILAQLKFEQAELQRFFERLGSSNPKFTPDMSQSAALEKDEKALLEIVTRQKVFQRVQLNSPFPVLRTVRLLASLIERGLIYVEGESGPGETFQDKDIQYFEEHIFPEGVVDGRIVILGVPTSGKSEIVRKIAGHQQMKTQTIQYLDFTRIRLKKDMNLTVFGISIDEEFQPVFEKIAQEMLAYIFLMDYQKPESFEYTKYLLNKMLQTYHAPCVIGLTNIESADSSAAVREARKILAIPGSIRILPVNPDSFKDIRSLFYNLGSASQDKEGGDNDV